MRRRALFTAMMAATACAPGGGDDASGAAVRAHLSDIAPHAIVPDSFSVIDVRRDGAAVAFRTVWAFEDTSGVWVDTSAVLTATVVESDGRPRVTGYDPALAAHVVELVDEDRRRRYEDLLDAVHHVYHAIVEAGWYYAEQGIDPAALHARVEAGGHTMAHPWGITPIRPGEAQVIWLADADGPSAICALPITDGERRAPEFDWVRDRQWFTCRGRTPAIYSRAAIPEEVRGAMRSHGVMPSAPAAPGRGAGTHQH